MFGGLFFEFLTHSTLGVHNFLGFISFLTNFSAPKVLIRGVQIVFGHQKQWNPSLGFGLP
jgi:hypothetical protein